MGARYIVGDVLEVLATLPDASVDLVMTSPPFLALRSYLPADHPLKGKEIGSEPTPGEFIDTLLDVVVECRRVLAPHGSICFELGDTYAGSGGAGGDYADGGIREGQPRFRQGYDRGDGRKTLQQEDYAAPIPRSNRPKYKNPEFDGGALRDRSFDEGAGVVPSRRRVKGQIPGWPLDKSLCLIPQSFAWALSYGRNPFTGREIEPWRVRNIVVWARPNPPVGALGDKFRPATSYLTIACTSRTRYFDLDAVRTPATREGWTTRDPRMRGDVPQGEELQPERVEIPSGAPPLDYWVIPTQPYKGSHYATFPTALCIKPIEAMCPRKVCRVCGEPSRRIVEAHYVNGERERDPGEAAEPSVWQSGVPIGRGAHSGKSQPRKIAAPETLGWTDCGCRCETDCQGCAEGLPGDFEALEPASGWPPCTGKWRPGVVLDPFCGSGTTLEVATGHGRDAIGVDLDVRNSQLARERVGMFLTVEGDEEPSTLEPPENAVRGGVTRPANQDEVA